MRRMSEGRYTFGAPNPDLLEKVDLLLVQGVQDLRMLLSNHSPSTLPYVLLQYLSSRVNEHKPQQMQLC
jgi:hypothetical protein